MADEIASGASMLAAGAVDGNFLTRLRDIEQRLSVLEGANMQAAALDEISSDMGDIRSGRFIAATEGWEPTEADFVGSFMSAEGEDFSATGGGTIHVGSAKGGTISAGFNTDGDLVGGLGSVKINQDGFNIIIPSDPTYLTQSYIKFYDVGGTLLSYISPTSDGALIVEANGIGLNALGSSGDTRRIIERAGTITNSGGTVIADATRIWHDGNSIIFDRSQYVLQTDQVLSGGTVIFQGGTITADRFIGSFDLSGTLNGSVNGGTIGATSAVISGALTAGTITAQAQGGTPTAPGAGYRTLYPKTDGWYDLNSGGTASRLAYASEIPTLTYPKRFAVMGDEITTAVTTQFNALATELYAGFWAPTVANANNGDEYTFGIFVAAGDYTFYHLAAKGAVVANIDWYVDGSKVATGRSWYNSTNVVYTDSFSVTIATSGYHTVKLKANGKNASSSDYAIRITKIWGKQATD